ncbi:hypothetical protein D3C75_1281970 [compost metagenome]
MLVQPPQGIAKRRVRLVRTLDTPLEAMDRGLWITGLDTLRRRQAARAENDDRRRLVHVQPCHFSPGTMINEK